MIHRPLTGPLLGLAALLAPAAASLGQDRPPADAPRLLEQPGADFQARRRDLMAALKGGDGRRRTVVVVRGANNTDREDFEEGRFRQANTFAYLTGIEVPGAYLILRPDEGRSALYLPPGLIGNRVMNGDREAPKPGPETAEALGFDKVESTGRFLADLFGAIEDPMRGGFRGRGGGGATVYLLSPSPRESANGPDARFARFLREGAPSADFRDLAPHLAELRKAKTKAELALLQKAIDITGEAQAAVMRTIRPGIFEYELEGPILGAFRAGGAERPGFASIVGSGPNSCIPHYFDNDRRLESGDLVVVDIGAEYRYYTADVTRTYPATGKFTERQRAIYGLVLDAQADAARQMKPGVTRLGEMTGLTRAYLRKSPLRARDDRGEERTMDHFFIHGLSHYLGMDVHDVGDMSKPIAPGEVFTIEPGLYIKGENLGVRIEDDYVMTDHGPEKLTANIPSDPDEIERRIAEARRAEKGQPIGVGRE